MPEMSVSNRVWWQLCWDNHKANTAFQFTSTLATTFPTSRTSSSQLAWVCSRPEQKDHSPDLDIIFHFHWHLLYLLKIMTIRTYRVIFNDCIFSFSYQIALILYFWYKIGGKMFICVLHLMNSDLKLPKNHFLSKLIYVEKMSDFQI